MGKCGRKRQSSTAGICLFGHWRRRDKEFQVQNSVFSGANPAPIMAVLHASASLSLTIRDASFARSAPKVFPLHRRPLPNLYRIGTAFATGSPLVLSKPTGQKKHAWKPNSVSIRCEQSTQGSNNLDVWLGRLAMVGFAIAISVEIATGKGLLENFGLTTPLPTVALAVTALVGILTAVFIFQSASKS